MRHRLKQLLLPSHLHFQLIYSHQDPPSILLMPANQDLPYNFSTATLQPLIHLLSFFIFSRFLPGYDERGLES